MSLRGSEELCHAGLGGASRQCRISPSNGMTSLPKPQPELQAILMWVLGIEVMSFRTTVDVLSTELSFQSELLNSKEVEICVVIEDQHVSMVSTWFKGIRIMVGSGRAVWGREQSCPAVGRLRRLRSCTLQEVTTGTWIWRKRDSDMLVTDDA